MITKKAELSDAAIWAVPFSMAHSTSGELKDMVTSPGGTTIEGCEALEKAGMRGAVIECINVSTEKSRSL